MSGQENKYLELSSLIKEGKITDALQMVADHFREQQKFDELFEIEKCRIRHQLGLPIENSIDSHNLGLEIQQQLEDKMLDLCREIGTAHCRLGNISRGWLYLQPLMDRDFVEDLFSQIDTGDENIEELIEIGLGQWAAPLTGYRLLIQTRGTCNAITFFDTQIIFQESGLRSELASILVNHVYNELLSNVVTWVAENQASAVNGADGSDPAELQDLVAEHSSMFANCGHHLDISHLASIVRIARLCVDPGSLDQARQLADYGSRLDEQLKYSGDTPFEELFESHRRYFDARLNRDLDENISYFRLIYEKSRDPRAAETLIELHRTAGDSKLAIEVAIGVADDAETASGLDLIELAAADCDYERVKSHFLAQDDLASFCIAAVIQNANQKRPSQ